MRVAARDDHAAAGFHPGPSPGALLGTLAALGAKPAVRRIGFAFALMAFRKWRRR